MGNIDGQVVDPKCSMLVDHDSDASKLVILGVASARAPGVSFLGLLLLLVSPSANAEVMHVLLPQLS